MLGSDEDRLRKADRLMQEAVSEAGYSIIPPLPEPRYDPISEVTLPLISKFGENQEKFLQELFGPGGPLEGTEKDWIIEQYPPDISMMNQDTFDNTVQFRMTANFRIRPKTDAEKQADSSQ